MDDLEIRPAEAADHATLVDFNIRLAWETEHKRLDSGLVGLGVMAVLTDPAKGRYFVAETRGIVVGQLMHTREWSDWRNGDLWWVQSVYIAPEVRGRGVFRRLYEHLRAEARSDGTVVGIRLYVEAHNAAAKETYRRIGLRDAGYQVMEELWSPRVPDCGRGSV